MLTELIFQPFFFNLNFKTLPPHHQRFRSFSDDHIQEEAFGFVDGLGRASTEFILGFFFYFVFFLLYEFFNFTPPPPGDLVEMFAELSGPNQTAIAEKVKMPLDQLIAFVDSLAQLH